MDEECSVKGSIPGNIWGSRPDAELNVVVTAMGPERVSKILPEGVLATWSSGHTLSRKILHQTFPFVKSKRETQLLESLLSRLERAFCLASAVLAVPVLLTGTV